MNSYINFHFPFGVFNGIFFFFLYVCFWQTEIFNQLFHGLSGNLAQLPDLCELSPDFFPLQGGSKGE